MWTSPRSPDQNTGPAGSYSFPQAFPSAWNNWPFQLSNSLSSFWTQPKYHPLCDFSPVLWTKGARRVFPWVSTHMPLSSEKHYLPPRWVSQRPIYPHFPLTSRRAFHGGARALLVLYLCVFCSWQIIASLKVWFKWEYKWTIGDIYLVLTLCQAVF